MQLKKLFFPHDNKSFHIKSLDGLRGLAVVIVLLAHSHHVNGENNVFQYFGRIGVYIFYILSAYLLDMQIVLKLKNNGANTYYWLNYCLRRFLRIVPIYFLALIGYYLLNRNLLGNFVQSPEDIIRSVFMLESHGVFWSIPVEFKYYIFSPFLMLLFHKVYKWDLKLILPTAVFIYFLSMYINFKYGLPWTSTLKSIPAFLLGSLLAIIKTNGNKLFNIRVLEIVTLVGLGISNMYTTEFFFVNDIRSLINIYVMPIFLSGIFISAQYGLLKKIMEYRFFRFLGSISFSVYLSHMIFALGLKKYGFENNIIDFILYFILTVTFSSISYLLIEFPTSQIKLKKHRKIVVSR